jgi:tetratricopeptide (TPR) repeat protein
MTISPPAFEKMMAAALGSYNAGRFAECEEVCRTLLSHAPRHPAVHQLLAVLAMARNDVGAAHNHIVQSLTERPQHVPSLVIAGKVARIEGDLATAAQYFERASALAPGADESEFLHAVTLVEMKSPAAVPVLQRLLDRHPQHVQAWYLLGVARQAAGETRAAQSAFERSLALAPALAEAWFNLGLARQDLHDLEGAAEAFRAALERRPDYVEAAVNLGIVLQDAHRMEEAMEAYRLAVRLRPDTFGRIAHALSGAPAGQVWLNVGELKRALGA